MYSYMSLFPKIADASTSSPPPTPESRPGEVVDVHAGILAARVHSAFVTMTPELVNYDNASADVCGQASLNIQGPRGCADSDQCAVIQT